MDGEKNLSNPLCNSLSYQQDVKNNLPNLGRLFFDETIDKEGFSFLFFFSLLLDTLDNEWLGQGFRERLSTLESTLAQLETPNQHSKSMTTEKTDKHRYSSNECRFLDSGSE